MKNTILWSALFTLMGTQVYADQQVTTPQPTNAAVTAPAAVPTPSPTTTTVPATAPASTPAIDCDYKIPPETKKIDQAIILSWSAKAVTKAFSFNPNELDAQMQKLQTCFTEQGWTGFNTALQKSGNIDAIKSQKLTVTSQVDGLALITGTKDNQWFVTLPIAVTYQNEKEKVSQLLSVDLTVGRKPNGDLGITQMIANPRGTVTLKKPPVVEPKPENTNADTTPKNATNPPPLGKPQ